MPQTIAQKMYNIKLPTSFFSFLFISASIWYIVPDALQCTVYITANYHLWIVWAKSSCSNSTGLSAAIQQ